MDAAGGGRARNWESAEWAGDRLILRGDFGLAEAGGLRESLSSRLGGGLPGRITVDWSEVGRLHLSAVQLLLSFQVHVNGLGGEIEYGGTSEALSAQLRCLGASGHFPPLGDLLGVKENS